MTEPAAPRDAEMRIGADGLLRLAADGRMEWSFAGREARAGDGVAAKLLDTLTSGDPSGLHVSDGSVRVVSVAAHPASGGASDVRERSLDVDQTNLSVVVDESAVVKLVGSWGAADRAADALLALDGSGLAPGFRGALRWALPGRGETTVAIAAELLPGTVDGWTWAVEDVLASLDGGGQADAEWPTALGRLTARLHARLGATASSETVRLSEAVAAARAALDRAETAASGTDTGTRLAARRPELERALAAALDAGTSGLRVPLFRAHGDLHVGQILRRPEDDPAAVSSYRVIDFDGDPQASAEERDRPASVHDDLAHLSTSIDMVASVVQRRLGAADRRLAEWAVRARGDLLAAYRAELALQGASHLAGDDASIFDRALAVGEIEYLAREMVYATRFLPRWLYAADGAVTARFAPAPDQEDPPWTPPASPTISA